MKHLSASARKNSGLHRFLLDNFANWAATARLLSSSIRIHVFTWDRFPHYATLLLLVAGSALAWLEYRRHVHESQIQRTLAYVDMFNDPDLSHAWFDVYKAQATHVGAIVETVAKLPSQNERDKAFYRAVNQLITRMDLELEVAQIVGVLDDIAICLDIGMCDRAIADEFVEDYAGSFWGFYAPFIQRVRLISGNNVYGSHLEAYVNDD